MLWSTTVKIFNHKIIIFWSVQKIEICRSEYVNSAQSEKFEIWPDFSFLHRSKYNEFVVENFNIDGS